MPSEILLALLTSSIGVSELISNLRSVASDKRTDRLEQARQHYLENVGDTPTPFEQKRQGLLSKLMGLQADVILSISDTNLLIRTSGLLVEQIVGTYEAKTDIELSFVELAIGRIEGTLRKYRQWQQRRILARWLAVGVSILALFGLGGVIYWSTQTNGPKVTDVLPLIQIPLPVLVWSGIGSFTAILYRFNKSGDVELQDPLRWLFTRPITGVVMGVVSYLIMKVGLLSITGSEDIDLAGSEIFWIVAFISGFSDRFVDSFLKTLVGQFGGDKDSELVSAEGVNSVFYPPSIASGLQSLVEDNFLPKPRSEPDTPLSSVTTVSDEGESEGADAPVS